MRATPAHPVMSPYAFVMSLAWGGALGLAYPLGRTSFCGSTPWVVARVMAAVVALMALHRRPPEERPCVFAARWFVAWWMAGCVVLMWLPSAVRYSLDGGAKPFAIYVFVAAYGAAYAGIAAWCAARARFPLYLTMPLLWLACEWVRGEAGGGFAWMDLGTVLHAVPPARALGAVIGARGVGALLLGTSGALAQFVSATLTRRGCVRHAIALVVVPMALLAYGSRVGPMETQEVIRVGLLHMGAGVSSLPVSTPSAVFEAYRALAVRVSPHADVVVWPEGVFPRPLRALVGEPMRALGATGAWHLIGALRVELRQGRVAWFNSLVVVDPFGIIRAFHDKRRLVPFVEAPLLGFSSARSFERGGDARLLPAPGRPLALLCYESTMASDRTSTKGPGFIALASSERFQSNSAEPWGQLAQAQLRAAEEGRALVRVSTEDYAAVLDADGSVRTLFEGDVPEAHIVRIHTRTGWTPFMAMGQCSSLLVCAALLVQALACRWAQGQPPRNVAGHADER